MDLWWNFQYGAENSQNMAKWGVFGNYVKIGVFDVNTMFCVWTRFENVFYILKLIVFKINDNSEIVLELKCTQILMFKRSF